MHDESHDIGPKRILIFSFVYFPRFIGGAEIAIQEITNRIPNSHIEFDLIALRLDKRLPSIEKIGNVTVHRVGYASMQTYSSDSLPFHQHILKYAYPFLAAYKASKLHKVSPYNGIWAMMANYSGFGALLFKLFNMNVPMLLTLQEGDPIPYIKKRVRYIYPLFRMIFTKADVIQPISKYLGEFARSMGFTGKLAVVPNGVDVSHFSKAHDAFELQELKETLEKKENDVFLVTTSRLVVKNAVGDVIRSLKFLPDTVKFLVVGQGYQEAELKKLAEDIGVSQRVRFLGYIPHAEMPKYLKISDVFIRPSLSEGFGNSFIEAMAAGLPVVATEVGGIPDFLKNKETGLFCAVNDPKDIARKVEIYMRDVFLKDEIVDNAMHMVIDRYDWKRIVDDMKNTVFDTLLEKK